MNRFLGHTLICLEVWNWLRGHRGPGLLSCIQALPSCNGLFFTGGHRFQRPPFVDGNPHKREVKH